MVSLRMALLELEIIVSSPVRSGNSTVTMSLLGEENLGRRQRQDNKNTFMTPGKTALIEGFRAGIQDMKQWGWGVAYMGYRHMTLCVSNGRD